MIILIASLDMANGIGDVNGNLLYDISEDMKHFKETTTGNICVFGRKTAESLPNKKPLSNRRNILLTKDINNSLEGFETVTDINYIIDISKNDDVYICGGGEIYNQFFPHAHRMILTHIHAFNFDARVFFPDYSPREWKIEDMVKYEENDEELSFTIAKYNRYIEE